MNGPDGNTRLSTDCTGLNQRVNRFELSAHVSCRKDLTWLKFRMSDAKLPHTLFSRAALTRGMIHSNLGFITREAFRKTADSLAELRVAEDQLCNNMDAAECCFIAVDFIFVREIFLQLKERTRASRQLTVI